MCTVQMLGRSPSGHPNSASADVRRLWDDPRADIPSELTIAHPMSVSYQRALIGGCGYATFIILHQPCNNTYMYDCILAQGTEGHIEPDNRYTNHRYRLLH